MAATTVRPHAPTAWPALFARRLPDPGLPVALLAAAFALWPLLTRASLPTLTDAQHHVYRTYEVLSAWREGIGYLRWAPDFFYGYGYPVFNYYAPLTYYLAAAYGLLFGPVAGVKFVLVAAALLGAAGAYLLARDQWGPLAATAAAASYCLSPYLALVDPVLRGAAPETLALGLAPMLLWMALRLGTSPSRARFVATTLLLAAVLLAHNLLSIVIVAILFAWLAFQAPAISTLERRHAALALAAALILGLGLAAFFWLPAWLERDAVQLQGAFLPGEARGLIPAAQLFGPAAGTDARAVQIGAFRFRLGLPQWAFGCVGALALLRFRPRPAALFFGLLATVSIVLMLPAAAPVWHVLRPLAYLQFAWRLLGVAALALAMLAAVATQWGATRVGKPGQAILAGIILGTCLLAGLALLSPMPWPDFGRVDRAAILDLELSGRWGVGTTHGIEFLPRGVQWTPVPQPAMVAADGSGTVEKVDRARLPAGAEVTPTAHGTLHDAFRTASLQPFSLRLLTHAFPGWTAYVDGQRAPIHITEPEGWLSVDVPAGDHVVLVRLEDTTPRRLGWTLSGISALGVFASLLVLRRGPRGAALPASQRLPLRTAAAFAALVLVALLARGLVDAAVRAGQAARRLRAAPLARFAGNIELMGFVLPQTRVAAGATFPLTLRWQASAPAPLPYSVFVHLYADDGSLWGQSDLLDPAEGFPATRWQPAELLQGDHVLTVLPNTPPGLYRLAVGLWYRPTGERNALLDAAGQATADSYYVLTNELQVTTP